MRAGTLLALSSSFDGNRRGGSTLVFRTWRPGLSKTALSRSGGMPAKRKWNWCSPGSSSALRFVGVSRAALESGGGRALEVGGVPSGSRGACTL